MKILQISDTHNLHQRLTYLPTADVIVHCGDFTDQGTEKEVLEALKRVSENRTVISISHRVSAKMGRIIPIEQKL